MQSLWRLFLVSQYNRSQKLHFPPELDHGSGTRQELTLCTSGSYSPPNPGKVQTPTLWKAFHVKCPTPHAGRSKEGGGGGVREGVEGSRWSVHLINIVFGQR